MFFKDFVSVKRKKIKKGASQTYDTPSYFLLVVLSLAFCGTIYSYFVVLSLHFFTSCILLTSSLQSIISIKFDVALEFQPEILFVFQPYVRFFPLFDVCTQFISVLAKAAII